MENALFITTSVHDGLSWLGRPICLIIGALIVVSIVLAVRRRKKRKADDTRIAADLGRTDSTMSLIAVGLLLAVFVLRVWRRPSPVPADVGPHRR